ncbi:MAG TPA: cytochrome-c peroxidase, partial [Anaerolineae bacterium]|nr:cytochrome-c peroxidase [Anaerolineae bacterium]
MRARHVLGLALLTSVVSAAEVRLPTSRDLLGLPPVPVPADNPLTLEKARLGRKLFEDKRFSADGTISCAHCHKPERAFQDGLPVSEGIQGQKGTRNAPTVINAAYFTTQFWDGRR